MSNAIPGGWTSFNFSITGPEIEAFKQAMEGHLGVGYTPLACATQVVAGTNYCFLCKGKVVYPNAPEFAAKVYIYKPLQGNAHVTEISRVNP